MDDVKGGKELPCEYMEKIPKSHRINCNYDDGLCLDPINYAKCGKLKRYQI